MANSFVNPYTFIPLEMGDKSDSSNNDSNEKASGSRDSLLTGSIICKLTAKTDIAIPDTAFEGADRENSREYPFFNVAGEPVIPGSSIRGVVRSVFEALTNSCMSVTDNRFHSMSGMKAPGLLEKKDDGSYALYKAVRYRVKDAGLQNHSTGELLRFDYREGKRGAPGIVEEIGSGFCRGWYIKAHPFKTDRGTSNPSIFERGNYFRMVEEKCIDAFEENIQLYVKNNEEDDVSVAYLRCFKKMKSGEGQVLPVWYSTDEDGIQFAPAQISRSVYAKRPSDFLNPLDLTPCNDAKRCCSACNLFGFVSSEGSKASSIRFGDAHPIGNVSMRWVYLPDLMEPRTSSFEFYLRNDTKERSHSFTPESKGTQLSGRKMYWHHKKGLTKDVGDWTEFNSKMELVEAGASFGFEVCFDSITSLQLNQIVYALTLGQAWDAKAGEERCHKIGHGKPVGLGSVYVELVDVFLRKYDQGEYSISSGNDWKWGRDQVEQTLSNVTNIMRVTSLNAIDENAAIDYPRKDPDGDIFAWFADNRDRFARGAAQNYCVVLPKIGDSQLLPRNPKSRNGNNPNNQGKRERHNSSFAGQPRRRESHTAERHAAGSRRTSGVIVEYRAEKRYGFIEYKGYKRIFFHISEWRSSSAPNEGQRVTFKEGVNNEGANAGKPCAFDVRTDQ